MAARGLTRRGRGRPRKTPLKVERGYHFLCCRVCGAEREIPRSAKAYTCSDCVTKMMPPPESTKQKQGIYAKIAEAKGAQQRKTSDALSKGKKPPRHKKISELPRGWHRRSFFEIKVLGKTYYYAEGKEITQKEYDKIKDGASASSAKASHLGFGRGWHLRKLFVAPNGDKYSYGKKQK